MLLKRWSYSLAIVLMMGISGQTEASGTTGAQFLCIEVPASSAALAAGAAARQGSAALTWNPAGIMGESYPGVAFTHFSSFVDTAYEQIEGVYPGWLEGSWAMRIFYASTYNFMEMELGEEIGSIDNHDLLIQLAYARGLAPGLAAGVALKFFESALAGYHRQGAAIDAGMQYQTLWPWLALGVAIQNLGTMSAFEEEAASLPLKVLGGAMLKFVLLSGHEINLLADVHQPLAGDEDTVLAFGLKYSLWDMILLRGGYRFMNELGNLSMGAGFRMSGFGLDYAYQPFAELGNNHRVTLAYLFQPRKEKPAPATSRPAAPSRKTAHKSLAAMKQDVPTLTMLPRKYAAKVVFIPPRVMTGIPAWDLIIKNDEGRIIKCFPGTQALPKEVVWDGRDDQGRRPEEGEHFKFVFKAGNKVYSHTLPYLPPALKLRFRDRTAMDPEVRFRFGIRPPVQDWKISVWDEETKQIVARFTRTGNFPYEWIWDGKDRSGKTADVRRNYQYGLEVNYADQFKVLISDKITPITAKKVDAPEGCAGILITDILFDFNRAELKPEVTDKLMLAAELMKRYPGQAAAICEGHADEIGTEKYNQDLSERRAHIVAKFLARQPGIARKDLSIIGYGKSRPKSSLDTEAARTQNRRVEVRIIIPKH